MPRGFRFGRGGGAGGLLSGPLNPRQQQVELAEQAVELPLDAVQAHLELGGWTALGQAGAVEPLDAVLDRLQALGQRADAAGEPFDVGGRGQVERAQRHLLRLGRLLAGVEGPVRSHP